MQMVLLKVLLILFFWSVNSQASHVYTSRRVDCSGVQCGQNYWPGVSYVPATCYENPTGRRKCHFRLLYCQVNFTPCGGNNSPSPSCYCNNGNDECSYTCSIIPPSYTGNPALQVPVPTTTSLLDGDGSSASFETTSLPYYDVGDPGNLTLTVSCTKEFCQTDVNAEMCCTMDPEGNTCDENGNCLKLSSRPEDGCCSLTAERSGRSHVVGIAVGVSVGVAALITAVVVIIVILRRRRRPMQAKDLDHTATAPATTTNAYLTAPGLAPSSPTLYQDINDVSTTATKQTTSDYEEPEPITAQQRNEVHPTPSTAKIPLRSTTTDGDTTLIDNTLYNMDNNSTTCLTTTSRDPTYSDTTLIDNSLYHM